MEPLVEVYSHPDWGIRSCDGLDTVAHLESVDLDLPLRDLYADLRWDAPE